jgi:hypothetical protein
VALEVEEGHSCVKFAVEVRMVEAFLDSQVFHNQSKKHSGALNVLILTSQARLVHNLVVGCRTEDLKVFADVLHMKVQNLVDGTRQRKEVDSTKVGKDCGHKEMLYSAKKDAAAVVLDPC